MSEEIDKHVTRKYDVQQKLGKGVRARMPHAGPKLARARQRCALAPWPLLARAVDAPSSALTDVAATPVHLADCRHMVSYGRPWTSAHRRWSRSRRSLMPFR